MNTNDFVELVQKNAARVRQYQLGHDGSDGKCDCIGLIIGAVRLGGLKWPWTHGSNYTARHLTCDLRADAPLKMGDLVFKARSEGESGYDLPAKYRTSGDLHDYYHVGVVTCEAPLVITHCTSVQGGIKRDLSRGKWRYSGQLKLIKEGEKEPMSETVYMQVVADQGDNVNLRNGSGTNYGILARVPVGAKVALVTEHGEWAYIRYGERQGYMQRKFLRAADAAEESADSNQGGALYQHVKRVRELMKEINGELDAMEEGR